MCPEMLGPLAYMQNLIDAGLPRRNVGGKLSGATSLRQEVMPPALALPIG